MPAIIVRDVSKKFRVYFDKGQSFKDRLLFKNRSRHEDRWVLNGVSFEVEKGEAIGLIGHNGCGKSTLLKLITRIMYPDKGTIQLEGRVSSLIELGAGFHPDMSGRENIYTNASIFGLTHKEIDARLQNIIDFSELGEFIDNPVRTYSSGMYMRLAFAVAIHVDADILLIDEILAVGDVNFQTKCFERLQDVKSTGTTIIIVSHSLQQIEQICDRSIWILDGNIKEMGKPKYVHEAYLNAMDKNRVALIEEKAQASGQQTDEGNGQATPPEQPGHTGEGSAENALPAFCGPKAVRMGTHRAEFTGICMCNEHGERKSVFFTGEKIVIKTKYVSKDPGFKGNFGIGIFRDDGVHCYGSNVDIESNTYVDVREKGEVTAVLTNNNLLPGRYFLDIAIHSEQGVFYDDIRNVFTFQIVSKKRDIGLCRLESDWSVDGCTLPKRSYD